MLGRLGAHVVLALVWLLHWLPLPLLAAAGVGLGRLLHALAPSRRRIALRNLELCLPELPEAERRAIVRRHFEWFGRSALERGLLWHASPARLRRLIRVHSGPHALQRLLLRAGDRGRSGSPAPVLRLLETEARAP